jgi:hypothetical protein
MPPPPGMQGQHGGRFPPTAEYPPERGHGHGHGHVAQNNGLWPSAQGQPNEELEVYPPVMIDFQGLRRP